MYFRLNFVSDSWLGLDFRDSWLGLGLDPHDPGLGTRDSELRFDDLTTSPVLIQLEIKHDFSKLRAFWQFL